MKRTYFCVAAIAALAVLSGCGGDDDASSPGKFKVGGLQGDVLVKVGDTQIKNAELVAAIAQAKAQAAAQGGAPFPKEGSKEYADQRRTLLDGLVLQEIVSAEAKRCGKPCEVSEKDVDAQITQIVQTNYQGKRKDFDKFLKDSKLSLADARRILRLNLVNPKIYESITKGTRVTDADAKKFYDQNQAQYRQPAGRHVYHILVPTQAKARALRAAVNDLNFAQLAAKDSTDPGSKDRGGDLGILTKGQFVPEFEKAAFALKSGQISQPVKTQFGFHLIRVVDEKERTTPFAEVKEQIVSTQLDQKKRDEFEKWRTKTIDDWRGRTTYASQALVPESLLNTTSTSSTTPPSSTGAGGPATP